VKGNKAAGRGSHLPGACGQSRPPGQIGAFINGNPRGRPTEELLKDQIYGKKKKIKNKSGADSPYKWSGSFVREWFPKTDMNVRGEETLGHAPHEGEPKGGPTPENGVKKKKKT